MATLGEKLKSARERMGASTSQAAAATRIKIQHIEAMESGQFQRIPAPTYAKGFLRMYAEYLGLDPAPLVREYTEQHMPRSRPGLTTPSDAAPRVARPAPPPPAAAPAPEPEIDAAPSPPRAPRRPRPDLSAAWARAVAACRPLFARVPWRIVGAVAVLAVAVVAIGRVAGSRARGTEAALTVNAAEPVRLPADVPTLVRQPPEPYLEAQPAGRPAP